MDVCCSMRIRMVAGSLARCYWEHACQGEREDWTERLAGNWQYGFTWSVSLLHLLSIRKCRARHVPVHIRLVYGSYRPHLITGFISHTVCCIAVRQDTHPSVVTVRPGESGT